VNKLTYTFLFGTFLLNVHAQDILTIERSNYMRQHLEQIDIRELPELIAEKLANDNYGNWILQMLTG